MNNVENLWVKPIGQNLAVCRLQEEGGLWTGGIKLVEVGIDANLACGARKPVPGIFGNRKSAIIDCIEFAERYQHL